MKGEAIAQPYYSVDGNDLTSMEDLESDEKTCGIYMEDQDNHKEMEELHTYLDMVKEMVRPGCPEELLKQNFIHHCHRSVKIAASNININIIDNGSHL